MKSWVRDRKLQRMEDFEQDAIRIGAISACDTGRDPNDETKWTSVHMDRLYRLWQAGARYGKEMKNGPDERVTKTPMPF